MSIRKKDLSISSAILILFACLVSFIVGQAQTPSPSPTSSPGVLIGGYEVSSSVELGVRGLDVNGNHEKYRSDLNYGNGFRIFDSSFMVEDRTAGPKLFNTILVTTTGFGADPTGSFRLNVDKTGLYKFDSNIRKVKYFNFLNNHAAPLPFIGGVPRGQHNFDTEHSFGDFDLTIFPESNNLRFRLGYSFNDTTGPGTFTTRFQSDEYEVGSHVETGSHDFRAGVEGKLFGFNLGLTYGLRQYDEDTSYFQGPSVGNNLTNNSRIANFQRIYPIDGNTNWFHFYGQRTFADRLDITGRFIYSLSKMDFSLQEPYVGRDNSNNFIDLDRFDISGDAKRPQSRGDIGATYRVTDKLRISNTFTFDQFNISGGNRLQEVIIRRTAAGVPNSPVPTRRLYHRITDYRRFSNLLEGDYQVNDRLGFSAGWRYTNRDVTLEGFQRDLNTGGVSGVIDDEHNNNTNSFLAAGRYKPLDNWSIFADVEVGDADNVFTRLANNEFVNFRIRSRTSLNRLSFNLSAIWKDNETPGRASATSVPEFTAVADTNSRIFSASVDWTPHDDWSFSGGYTYQHQTSRVDVIVPIGGVFTQGVSEYFVRDNHFFFDVSARPIKRVSVFASYRIDDDDGQGDRIAVRPQDIISSYPIKFQSPEIRLAIRLTRNIDWNVGYQYYDYKERQTQPEWIGFNQNYNAHLPYTSVRFYFGRSAVDR